MSHIDFFKNQAKLLLKDWKQRKQEHFAFNIKELFFYYNVDPRTEPSLMRAQHLLAQTLGRKSWSELINDSEDKLAYTKNAFIENQREAQNIINIEVPQIPEINIETNESNKYSGIVECLHCGQRFPVDNPSHLPSCDGEDWDLVPIEELD